MKYVLRWKTFEYVLPETEPGSYRGDRIEMALGEHIVSRVVEESGAPRMLDLWAFDFVKVDADGRHVYEAKLDPYEDIVEGVEKEKLVRSWQAQLEKEGAKDDSGAEQGAANPGDPEADEGRGEDRSDY